MSKVGLSAGQVHQNCYMAFHVAKTYHKTLFIETGDWALSLDICIFSYLWKMNIVDHL